MKRDRRASGTAGRRRIVLALFPPADESLLHALVPILADAFGAAIGTSDTVPLPLDAYNPARRQYRSTALLQVLAQQKQPHWERLLGITDVDLYTPDLNFVFGEADTRRGVTVFSTARLHAATTIALCTGWQRRQFMSSATHMGFHTATTHDA